MGYIAEKSGSMAIAMTVPLVAYLYVAWYSFRGSTGLLKKSVFSITPLNPPGGDLLKSNKL
jgi:hypothetical protein